MTMLGQEEEEAMTDTHPGDGNAARLRTYWLVGPGAIKIRWGTPGDFTRCVTHLTKYMPGRAEGYCQNLHQTATGLATGSDLHRVASGKPPRGNRIGPG